MLSGKKGQAATEYIIILAVVIIVALIVVGVISGIPRLGGSTVARAVASYWQQADIAITAAYFNQTNGSVVIRNNMPFKIMLANMSIGPEYSAANLPVYSIRSGAEAVVFFVNNTSVIPGDVAYSVTFIYYNLDKGLGPYNFTGEERLLAKVQ